MIPGYNHNIKYQETIFHVQTEDSGVDNPHIITHLFVGGNIIDTRKTSYADIAQSERLKEMLVELMQDQHKSMLRDLINGRFDYKIAERSVNAARLNGPAPLNVEAGAQHRSSLIGPSISNKDTNQKGPQVPIPEISPTKLPPVTPITAANLPLQPSTKPSEGGMPVTTPITRGLPPPPAPPGYKTSQSNITRYAPPPPAPQNETVIEAETLARAFESKNESAVDSIFGEDLISEKSLDEVILSYLAEDMNKS
ncbi:MAG: hypothetical protein JW841_08265 [Deltaproteobacteria bacterium]|nr:hypothetical protein [Deltaproteobacteria bacterium]